MTMNGNLTVTIVDAKELNKEDHLTKQDPYCIISLGGGGLKGLLHGGGTKQRYRTKTHNRGGTTPHWNETHTFNLNGFKSDAKLRVAVYDKDLIKDDSIGVAKIPLSELFENQSRGKHYYQLVEKHHSRRIAGYVGIIAKFDGAGMAMTDTKTGPTLMDKMVDKTLTTHDQYQQAPSQQAPSQQAPPAYQQAPYQQTPYQQTQSQAPYQQAPVTQDPYAKGAPIYGHAQGPPLYAQGNQMGTQGPTYTYGH